MIEIKNKKNCTGCFACYNVCPQKCISMRKDNEGFFYPNVDKKACLKCNKCVKVCPIINPFEKKENHNIIYAAINNDNIIRGNSSSGGVFYAIAEKILKNNGIVYGAAFDKEWKVHHTSTSNIEGLKKLQGSKYSQSQVNNVFKEIKERLKQGYNILFCGTPCQVSGLNHFLNKKYDNLLTIELLCHGVPSPLVWEKSLKEFLLLNHIKFNDIKHISFRKKVPNIIEYKFSVKDIYDNEYETFYYEFPFMKAFLSNLTLRPSCYNCISKRYKTGSDLIIGDLWNEYNFYPYNDSKGTSVVVINTNKGDKLIHDSSLKLSLISRKYINKNNSGFKVHQYYNNKNRNLFFKNINTNTSIFSLMNKYSKLNIQDKIIKKIIKIFFS